MLAGLNLVQKIMVILVGIIILCLGYGIFLETRTFFKANEKEKIKVRLYEYGVSVIWQVTVIMGQVSLFNLSALCSDSVDAEPILATWFLFGITIVLLCISLLFFFQKREKIRSRIPLKMGILQKKEIIFLLVIAAIVRIVLFRNLAIERWDAGEYYYRLGTACGNYDFTWQSIWDNFRLCNHSSIGFAMLYAIGEFLNPRRVMGVLYVNLFMTLIALYMIYEMLQKYWTSFDKRQAITATFLVSVAPLFLGTFGYVNTDYALTIVFIYMLYAQYKKQYLLLAFWGIVLTQTKETGVFVMAGYYLSHFILWMKNNEGNVFQKIDKILKNRVTWSTMIIGAVYARYVYKLRAFTAWSQTADASSQVLWSNTGENCFGFQPPYIWLRIKQLFFLNFSWIFLLLLLIAIVLILRKRMKVVTRNMAGIYGGSIGFVICSFFYVTAEIARYNILITVTFILIVFCIMEQLLAQSNSRRLSNILWGSLGILLIIQTFLPIDSISNLLFRTVDTGNGKMLFTSDTSDYYGDHLVNNYQYMWLDRAYDEMLREVEYDDHMMIVIPDDQYAGSHIHGNGSAYSVFWDEQVKRRVMYQNEDTIDIYAHSVVDVMLMEKEDLPEKAVIFFIPYYELDEDEQLAVLSERYQVLQENYTTGNGGSIKYYTLVKND